jgi:hypothetical protein
LPDHTCSRKSASITCAARTMCASAVRSPGGRAEISATRSVGANRAVFCSRLDVAGSGAAAGAAGGVDGACALHAASVATRVEVVTVLMMRR